MRFWNKLKHLYLIISPILHLTKIDIEYKFVKIYFLSKNCKEKNKILDYKHLQSSTQIRIPSELQTLFYTTREK